ncbi:MAG: peptidoglycan bridge formation glycyltransferase FemA/FemB family protein [Candidatus Beckwithbacteria bacterium]|nr:peptidoglycan bridge formation glycyltransferase FemA/FemB family protein [Candidatus Beckwithbacteria bacterium]
MLTVKVITDKAIWEDFILHSSQCSFLQSWNWGVFHESLGHSIFRLGFFNDNQLCGIALLIKINARRATYFECPAGPVLPWENQAIIRSVFQFIRQLADKEAAVFVRIRPNILKTDQYLNLVISLGLIKAPMHLHAETTWVLNLKDSEETLLKNMRKNTRYSVKKALNSGVEITSSIKNQDIQTLYRLQLAVAQRRHFVTFSYNYLLKQFQAFQPDNQVQLFKASLDNRTLAMAFIIFYGQEAVYHYAGSSAEVRQIPVSYALQWEVIRQAKKKGFPLYNFWGIAPTDNPHHRFAGVTLFKTGFGGSRVDYLPAHDLVIKPHYWLIYLFESLRRKWRHL